ncbi:hypothetical protein GFO_0642 [Christiangramia forsetii KT0803]|uniref:Uncharacterized protein n=1 Tax=Christiangramia forsetii (strain DSM 17595 / CGMCC 1.15422 / KT0803) TaxID=411154 RepID=A0LZ25_CHRFK|nr:hypothetical protein GFO_0642 [Christiangramia forsetii KT0803]
MLFCRPTENLSINLKRKNREILGCLSYKNLSFKLNTYSEFLKFRFRVKNLDQFS